MTEKDRRASPRFEPKPGRKVFYAEGPRAIRDSSADGVFVLDPEALSVGTRIDFSLRFDAQSTPLQGTVRRSAAQEGMAIEFAEMSPEARKRLRLHVTETNAASLLGWLEKKRLEKLSRILRTDAGVARGYDPHAFVFVSNQLAALLGKDSSRIDDVLEFMREKGWAGENGDRGTWWIL